MNWINCIALGVFAAGEREEGWEIVSFLDMAWEPGAFVT